jgi:uncharacterized membrane protein
MDATPEQRKQALAERVAREVKSGGRVESQSDFQAVIVNGKRPNHLLHLILTCITLGVWSLVWLGAVICGEKRRVVAVDTFGNVTVK